MTSDRRPTRRTFLIPSIPDLVFVALACLQVAVASMILLNRDGDLPRHIAVGKVMLDGGGLMRADFFSHTAYGQPFLAYEWLSQLIFAAVYEFTGLDAIAVLAAVAIAFAYALVTGFLIRRGVAADLVLLTVGAAALLGMTHWAARPHTLLPRGGAKARVARCTVTMEYRSRADACRFQPRGGTCPRARLARAVSR